MRRWLGSTVDVGVFGISVGISVLFVWWGVFFTGRGAPAPQQFRAERDPGGR